MVPYPVMLTPDGDGFVAQCPAIPGCISQGDTREAALANIADAIGVCLGERVTEGWELPRGFELTTVDIDEQKAVGGG